MLRDLSSEADDRGGTSDASAKLAAAAFYVFQLYEKAEEVVDTLKECAEDIGEPGVDYEFGLGLVSLACGRVESAEVLTASSSLVLRWDAPALEALLGSRSAGGTACSGLALDRGPGRSAAGAARGVSTAWAVWSCRCRRAGAACRWARGAATRIAGGGALTRLPARAGGCSDRTAGTCGAVFSLGRGGGALSPRTSRAGLGVARVVRRVELVRLRGPLAGNCVGGDPGPPGGGPRPVAGAGVGPGGAADVRGAILMASSSRSVALSRRVRGGLHAHAVRGPARRTDVPSLRTVAVTVTATATDRMTATEAVTIKLQPDVCGDVSCGSD